MIPVDQAIFDAGKGDCMRAVVASILELPLEAVPHFMLHDEDHWWPVYFNFFWAYGWEIEAYLDAADHPFDGTGSVNGYFDASVPSKNFPGKSHAVVLDHMGVVVHDPSPKKQWQGVNPVETGELKGWYTFKRRTA